MSKHDYTELDAAILSRIAQKPAWRFIDSRLQALRKAGKIVYSGKTGWSIANEQT